MKSAPLASVPSPKRGGGAKRGVLPETCVWLPLAALALLLALAGCAGGRLGALAPSGGAETRRLPEAFFGMQMHTLRWNSAEHARAAAAAAGLGVRLVRDEAHWHYIEARKGELRIPEEARENFLENQRLGLETLLILDYGNPHYDGGLAPASPEAIEAFGRYCFFMASELRGICRYFEIWNEPNTDGFWRPRHDAAAYARLFEVAAREVRRGNPEAVVIGVTLAGIDGEFLTATCANARCGEMDFVSIHPYCTPASPGAADIFAKMKTARDTAFAAGGAPERPIWVTEIGWPTHRGGGVSPRRQAEVLAQTYLLAATRPEVHGIVWYWLGPDGPDAEWAEDRFGLFHENWQGYKPAAHTLRALSAAFEGARVATRVENVEGAEGALVIRARDAAGRHLAALYCEQGEIALAVRSPRALEAIPLNGAPARRLEAPETGEILLTVTPLPLLLRAAAEPLLAPAANPLRLEREGGSRPLARGDRALFAPRGANAPASPGFLIAENDPAPPPWSAASIPAAPGEGGGLAPALEVCALPAGSAGEESETAPLAAWFTPAGHEHPSARLATALEICDPISLDARAAWLPGGRPALEWKVFNRSTETRKVLLRVQPGGFQPYPPNALDLPPGEVASGVAPFPGAGPESQPVETLLQAESGGARIEKSFAISHFQCHRAPAPLSVDGDLSDWPAEIAPLRLGAKEQIVVSRPETAWQGPQDASARAWLLWDEQWLYLAAEIRDDIHSETHTGFSIYQNDGLELYLDTDRETGRVSETFTDRQHQIGLFPANGKDAVRFWGMRNADSPGAKILVNRAPVPEQRHRFARAEDAPTLIIEAALPMSELGLAPAPGLELGFSLALDDDDTPDSIHPFLQDLQFQWSRRKNCWRNPGAFASLWLAGVYTPPPSRASRR